MKLAKENMIFSQLIAGGVLSDQSIVLNAFESVDKEDFVPLQFKRIAYLDDEILINDSRVIFRCSVLAHILNYFVTIGNAEDVLVVGDACGYTSALFSRLFTNCATAVINNTELEVMRKKLENNRVIQLDDIKGTFDIIFFDSGFYSLETINNIISSNLSGGGKAVYFTHENSFDVTVTPFEFYDVSAIASDGTNIKCLLKTKLHINCNTIK